MHAISAGCARHVETIVDKQTSRTVARQRHRTPFEFVQYSRAEHLFANLNEGNLCGYRSLDQVENTCELVVVRSCFARRRAARDRVNDRVWDSKRHSFPVCNEARSDVAT